LNPKTIQLDQFLKWQGLVTTGGQAKLVIQAGEVQLNGAVETRRKKKLTTGDRVTFRGQTVVVDLTVLWEDSNFSRV
jgi:ribosome-associated protein